jgi:hypothetical protein
MRRAVLLLVVLLLAGSAGNASAADRTSPAAKRAHAAARAKAKKAHVTRLRALASSSGVLSNGNFEGTLGGWNGYNASLSLASDGVSGPGAALVKLSNKSSNFSIYTTPMPVSSTAASTLYTGNGWVRSAVAGRKLCLRIREWSGATVVGSAQSCVTSASAWQPFPALTYLTLADGHGLDLYVYETGSVRGDSFETDGIGLDASAPAPAPAPTPTPTSPLAAPTGFAAQNVGATSLTLTWTPSTDTRVVSYTVLRDGAVVGTTSGSSYATASLTCATSYGFAVRGLDANGAASSDVTTSAVTAACAPTPTPTPTGTCTKFASTTGNDAGAGSASDPFRTAQHLFDSLSAGQTGCLQPGTYTGDIKVSTGGAAGSPITLTSATSPRAMIFGRVWVADSANDVVVKGLNLDARMANGLPSVIVNGDRVTFSGNDVTNGHTGICFDLGSDSGYGIAYDDVIDGNRIHDCGRLPSVNLDHGVYVGVARNTRVTNNVIFDNTDRGVQLFPDAQGTLVAHNVIDANGEGVIFSGEGSSASSNNHVTQNVITNSSIRHNVESYYGSVVGSGNVADFNCLWNAAQGNVGDQIGFIAVSNLAVDPLYTNRAGKDFRLSAGSPCSAYGPPAGTPALVPFS